MKEKDRLVEKMPPATPPDVPLTTQHWNVSQAVKEILGIK